MQPLKTFYVTLIEGEILMKGHKIRIDYIIEDLANEINMMERTTVGNRLGRKQLIINKKRFNN